MFKEENTLDMFKCDGCGLVFYEIIKSDDGENKFCDRCWREIEIETEVMNNEKEER